MTFDGYVELVREIMQVSIQENIQEKIHEWQEHGVTNSAQRSICTYDMCSCVCPEAVLCTP